MVAEVNCEHETSLKILRPVPTLTPRSHRRNFLENNEDSNAGSHRFYTTPFQPLTFGKSHQEVTESLAFPFVFFCVHRFGREIARPLSGTFRRIIY